ncbi:MAG: hypothetical protein COB68_04760 [SAR202 cluster bacterium]|jgi:hypothetical protein|nr:MAG: hypothetical protein COB68_04760 [SAR202 cluster bacterium]HIM63538.1 DUF2332 domain-containing protein [Dehalococcoidia bacterium]
MQELDRLALTFHRFAELECPGMSSLYESLCHSLAEEQDLLALAANARSGQPAPNLFMAAVHWLLTKGAQHTVTEYYPDISPEMTTHGDPYPIFRSFCLEHGDEIVDLISTRLVQTNVVRRCAVLLPAFAVAMGRDAGQPLSLVEIGASAGLNLLWDRYSYTYSDAQRWGDPDHPVQLSSIIRGDLRPPLPDSIPKVVFRVGLDLSPVDISDPDAVDWLRALVWPERVDEAQMLEDALEMAKDDPPRLLAGDALELLPEVLESIPLDSTLCLYHSNTLN